MSFDLNVSNQQLMIEVTNIATLKQDDFSTSAEAKFYIKNNQTTDLRITQTTSKSYVHVFHKIYFIINVRNLGPDNATNVVLIDDLIPKENIKLSSINVSHGSYFYSNGKFTWDLGEFSKDDSPIAIIAVVPTESGVYKSSAFIKSNGYDPNMHNNHASAKIIVRPKRYECENKLRQKSFTITYYINGLKCSYWQVIDDNSSDRIEKDFQKPITQNNSK